MQKLKIATWMVSTIFGLHFAILEIFQGNLMGCQKILAIQIIQIRIFWAIKKFIFFRVVSYLKIYEHKNSQKFAKLKQNPSYAAA